MSEKVEEYKTSNLILSVRNKYSAQISDDSLAFKRENHKFDIRDIGSLIKRDYFNVLTSLDVPTAELKNLPTFTAEEYTPSTAERRENLRRLSIS